MNSVMTSPTKHNACLQIFWIMFSLLIKSQQFTL